MSRLPVPGKDSGTWGDILNDYLSKSHASDGSLKDNVVGSSQIKDGAVGALQLDTQTSASLAKAENAIQNDTFDETMATKINDDSSTTRAALTAKYVTQHPAVIYSTQYPSITSAVDAVNATGGSVTLRIPPGSYTTGRLLFNVPNITVEAYGATLVLAAGTNESVVQISASATGFRWNGGIIDGNASQQSGTSHGVEYFTWTGGLRPADRGGFFGTVIQNVLTDGVNIAPGRVQINLASNTSIRVFGRYGVRFGGTDCALRDGAVGIGQICVYIDGNANWVNGSGIYSASQAAVYVAGGAGRYSTITNNMIDNNPGIGLSIVGTNNDTVDLGVYGNFFRANSQAGDGSYPDIYISEARAVRLSGNQTCLQTDRYRTSYALVLDTGALDIYDLGNVWDPLAHTLGIISDPSSRLLSSSPSYLSTDRKIAYRVNGDTSNRFQVSTAGLLQWGSGTAAPDVALYRETGGIFGSGQQFFAQRYQVRGTSGAGYVEWINTQSVTPAAPTSGARLFLQSSNGKVQLCVRFPTGSVQVISTEP